MSIKLKLEGFDGLLSQIQKAGGTIDGAAESCLKKSAQIMQSELTSQMQKSGVDSRLVSSMPPPTIEKSGNRVTAQVGYKKGAYNPKDPSDGYKIVFLNYGTPKRRLHGKVAARGFIRRAKSKASPKIKKEQEETLKNILGGLSQ